MKTRAVRRPGDRGTKKLVAQYGDRLVCVRYRYDEARKKSVKTVEVIVEETEWVPPSEPSPDLLVKVRIHWHEEELRERVKRERGRWDPDSKLWEVRHGTAAALGIANRIVKTHRGHIEVRSKPGETVMCVRLPVEPESIG